MNRSRKSSRSRRCVPLALLVLAPSGGCWASSRALAPDQLRNVRHVAVIPLQTPPLVLNETPHGAWMAELGMALYALPLAVVGGLVVVFDLPAAAERSQQQSARAAELLAAGGSWIATEVFARHAAARLRSTTPSWRVEVASVQPLPGLQDPAQTWHMTNWYWPARTWYGGEAEVESKAGEDVAPLRLDVVIALTNFEVFGGSVMLHVLVKVKDADDGRVLARAREYTLAPLRADTDLFDDGASALKQVIESAGTKLVETVLTRVGLPLRAD
ncbi:MAG TPA: hypothetical protein VF384_04440 [Planctomycetota bacterium]